MATIFSNRFNLLKTHSSQDTHFVVENFKYTKNGKSKIKYQLSKGEKAV